MKEFLEFQEVLETSVNFWLEEYHHARLDDDVQAYTIAYGALLSCMYLYCYHKILYRFCYQ